MGCQLSFHVASNSAFFPFTILFNIFSHFMLGVFPFTILFNIFSHFMQIIVLTSTLALNDSISRLESCMVCISQPSTFFINLLITPLP
ncbi:hypothetical protein Hanom_Chr01g00053691 [Helianthus anomalus]